VTDLLPPVVLPIEGSIAGLLKAFAEADAALKAWAASVPDTTRSIGPAMADEGHHAGHMFGAGFAEVAENDTVRAVRDVSNRLRDEDGRFAAAGSAAGHRFGASFLAAVRAATHRLGGGAAGGGGGGPLHLGGAFIGQVAGGLGSLAKVAFSMPSMITGLVFGAAQAIAAVAPLVGVLNLVPAAVMPAALALGTLMTALHGVGGAISAGFQGNVKKYTEALAKLAPAAQQTVKAIVALKPELHALRMDVQDSFFTGFAGDLKKVGGTYLPLMHTEMTRVAAGLNAGIREYTKWLKVPDTFKSITASLNNTTIAIQLGSHALLPFVSGLNDMVEVGSRFLPGMGAGLANLGDRFSAFMAAAAGTGKLESWIRGGLDALKLLGGLLKDVWGVLHPIIAALNATGGGGLGFLGTLLHQLAEFFSSAKGMATLTALFTVLDEVFSVFGDTLVALLPSLGELVISLGPVLVDAVKALQPALQDAADAVAAVVGWLKPFLPQLDKLTPAVTIFADAVMGLLVPAFVAWAAEATAAAVANIAATWEILVIAAAVAALGYGIYELVKHWSTVWKWIKGIAGDVGGFFAAIGDWFVDVWHKIVDALKAGLAWVEAVPGRVLAALKAFPGVLERGAREGLRRFAYAVGYGIGTAVKELKALPGQVWHIITSLWDTAVRLGVKGVRAFVGLTKRLHDDVVKWFHRLKTAALKKVHEFVEGAKLIWHRLPGAAWDALKTTKDKILGFLGDAGSWLVDAGKHILEGLLHGLEKGLHAVLGFFSDLGHAVVKGFNDAVGNKSPSLLFQASGANIVAGVVKGVNDNAGGALAAVRRMLGAASGAAGGAGLAVGRVVGVGDHHNIARVGSARPPEQVINIHVTVTLDGKVVARQLIPHAQRTKLRTGLTGLA
jgi:hypothetical protein